MVPSGCRWVLAVALLAPFAVSPAALAAEPAPPTDAEITAFVGVQRGLVADPSRAEAICAALDEDRESDQGSQDLAVIGRKVEASSILGPLVRRQAISGRRFAELSVQIAAALFGLDMADSADASELAKGKPGKNREALLQRSAEARSVAPRQAELVTALKRVDEFCGESDSDDDEGDAEL